MWILSWAVGSNWAELREAVRNLPDNPVVRRMQLAAQRKRRRKRDLGPLIIALIAGSAVLLIGLAIVIIDVYTSQGRPGGNVSLWSERDVILSLLHYSALVFICTYAFLWLFSGIYSTYRDALELLGENTRKGGSFVVDDLMGSSSLGNAEIVVGFLRVLLPPLWLRILVFYLVAFWMYITVLANFWDLSSIDYGNVEAIKLIVLLAPISLVCLMFSSTLATCCMSLFLIACGRQLRSSLVCNIGAVTNTLILVPWTLATGFMAVMFANFEAFVPDIEDRLLGQTLGIPLAAAILLVLTMLILLLIHEFHWLRPVFAIGGPLLIPGVTLLLTFILWAIAGSGGEEVIGILFGNIAISFGSVMPLNFNSVPSLMCYGATPVEMLNAQLTASSATEITMLNVGKVIFPYTMLFEWFRYPVLLLLQGALLAMTYRAAVNAVQRRRQT